MLTLYSLFLLVAIAAILKPDNIPDVLKQGLRWVLWRRLLFSGEPKARKVPFRLNGGKASSSDPSTWASFGDVWREYCRRPSYWSGLMRAFAVEDGITGIDADNAYPEWQGDTAEVTPWGRELQERLGARTYHESSCSGCGFHVFCFAEPPRSGQWAIYRSEEVVGKVEVYDRARFFVMTGDAGPTVPRVLTDCQADVVTLVTTLDRMKQAREQYHRPAFVPRPHPRSWSATQALDFAAKALARYGVTGPVVHPHRHNTLVRLLGALWRQGMPGETVEYVLQETNAHYCDPPYPPRHINAMVRSAQRWEA